MTKERGGVAMKRILRLTVIGLMTAASGAACTHGKGTKHGKEPGEPITPSGEAHAAQQPKAGTPAAGDAPVAGLPSAPPVAPMAPADGSCVVLDKAPGEPPYVVPGKDVVVTRIFKTCVTPDGRRGVERTTPWLAMGFPCTGGAGHIDIKGNYNNPKMVSFILGTDCAMAPASKEQVKAIATQALGLPPEAKLMGYTPFVLQYWEVPGMEDADTGFAIEVRSAAGVEAVWSKFKKNEPIHVRLFGRENSWGQGDNFYFVEGDLKQAGRTAFTLTVTQAKSLTPEERTEVKTRCEALRPARNCADVF
jgi:hypothetical protein